MSISIKYLVFVVIIGIKLMLLINYYHTGNIRYFSKLKINIAYCYDVDYLYGHTAYILEGFLMPIPLITTTIS